ncbi:uncharacterized protein LOC119840039 [Zerene cesonia]|uniref:uncharacterized protein LOC119840039 n=1 Tax=Zerene cesonia TaxID=33412 RepID=UPI0018E549D6|nr:uncharacterized protein LOC119840039 [Zerene cesonia]
MKLKSVRRYLLKKEVGVSELRTNDSVIIIDGAYFKETYKKSGCQFILGGEYDRYANYLKNILNNFVKNDIECFVVFNGGMKADIESRKAIHQNIIDRTDALKPGRQDNVYCEPIFAKDVQREVFDELNIKYYVCEYDHKEALITLATHYNYPILTNNFEYSLFGVSCIFANSLMFDVDHGFRCTVYHPNTKIFPFNNHIMSILLAVADEDSSYYKHLPKILKCHETNVFVSAQHWIRRQNQTSATKELTKYLSPEDRTSLLDNINNFSLLFRCTKHPVIKSFGERKNDTMYKIDVRKSNWFNDGVSRGNIAIPYINLKNSKTFSGSWLIVDKNKNDAILVALDIVFYALGLLTNSQIMKISFIGRQFATSRVWEIDGRLESSESLQLFYSNTMKSNSIDIFKVIIREILHDFDFKSLESLSKDCHMIIIALVYYFVKSKEDFSKGVYSILLSYFMLGPVAEEVGVLKRSNFSVTHNVDKEQESRMLTLKRESYVAAAQAFMDFFYINESSLKNLFYRDILHRITEFNHCLQHVNYLNKMCGANTKCTTYNKAINETFVYNIFVTLKDQEFPLDYLKKRIDCDPIYMEYKKIVDVFETCYKSVKA